MLNTNVEACQFQTMYVVCIQTGVISLVYRCLVAFRIQTAFCTFERGFYSFKPNPTERDRILFNCTNGRPITEHPPAWNWAYFQFRSYGIQMFTVFSKYIQ